MNLGSASPAVQAAVCKSVHDNVTKLIDQFMSSGFASLWRNQAKAQLESTQGKALLLKIVTDALDTEEKARAAENPTTPGKP